MKTTLDLPETLLHEAMKAANAKTEKEIVIIALEELVRKSKISGLKNYKGKVDLDIDVNSIRERGCQF